MHWTSISSSAQPSANNMPAHPSSNPRAQRNFNLQSFPVRMRTWLGSREPVYLCSYITPIDSSPRQCLYHYPCSLFRGSPIPCANSELGLETARPCFPRLRGSKAWDATCISSWMALPVNDCVLNSAIWWRAALPGLHLSLIWVGNLVFIFYSFIFLILLFIYSFVFLIFLAGGCTPCRFKEECNLPTAEVRCEGFVVPCKAASGSFWTTTIDYNNIKSNTLAVDP